MAALTSSAPPGAGAAPGRVLRPLPPTIAVLLVGGAALLGAALAAHPGLAAFDREIALTDLLAAGIAGALGLLLVVRPSLALVATVVFVALNLSEVLVRFHGLPSLLQLIALPLAVLLLVSRPPGDLGQVLRSPVLLLLALQAGLLAVSALWAEDAALAIAAAVRSGKALFVAAVVAVLASSLHRLRLALWAAVASGCLLGALAIAQSLTGRFDLEFGGLARIKRAQIWGDVFEPRIAGPLGDPNFFAQVLVMLVPLAFGLAWSARRVAIRALAFAAAALLTATIALTYSRGAAVVAALVVALSFVGHGLGRRKLLAAGVVLVAIALALPSGLAKRLTTLREVVGDAEAASLHPDSSFAKRRLLTRAAWEMFADHPWLGVGAGNFTTRFEPYGDLVGSPAPDYDDPGEPRFAHSFALEVASETGVVGLALWGLLVASALALALGAAARLAASAWAPQAALPRALALGLVGYLLAGLFLHLRFERYLGLLFGLIAALPGIAERARTSAAPGPPAEEP